MSRPFVHLSVHSEYSLGDSIIRVRELVGRVAELGMSGVGLGDDSNFFAVIKFYKAARARGIKPLIGVQVWVENVDKRDQPHKLLLYCRDHGGYRVLCRLLTKAYGGARAQARPVLRLEDIAEYGDSFIVLSGAGNGELGRALVGGREDEAGVVAERYLKCFGDRFYVELQRIGAPGEEEYIEAAMQLAAHRGVPVVATNVVQFLHSSDFDAHEIRVCINDKMILNDPRRESRFTSDQYLRSPEEMWTLFGDIPQALENSVEIARRCNTTFALDEAYLPVFDAGDGRSANQVLHDLSQQGLERQLTARERAPAATETAAAEPPAAATDQLAPYNQRLATELDIINDMGFAGYFLIVADFVSWSREHQIPVGPGRGSGAGSLVAWALGITEIDPIEHGLLFERFLNPERVSLPDFDIDFCVEQRDRVIDYVTERYGRERVSQIITYGTMAARAVVRDVARVLNHSYGFGDAIARLIPLDPGITLDEAMKREPLLEQRYQAEEEVRELIDKARTLEGLVRNAGRHAGGVVIAPDDLTNHTPLYAEPGSDSFVTHLDKGDLEASGMVKFDFLALNTLTILHKALELVNRQRASRSEAPLSFDNIPLHDKAVFNLLKQRRITGLFQLESHGMRKLVRRLKPDSFDDLVALVALYRPGPLQSGMVDDYVNRKHGLEAAVYPHPTLEPILRPTHGVILYQEQVMEIARVLAGYTLGEADLLREAMGKKMVDKMERQRRNFIDGAVAGNIPKAVANRIFDLMEHFAGYGFNKAHSTAYAMISYRTAWLKAHYPGEFMTASLSAEMADSNKVLGLIREARAMGLHIEAPAVNECEWPFRLHKPGHIRFGLGAIKGLGAAAVERVVGERCANQPYRDLYDLCERVDNRKVNRRALESLISAGALDDFGAHRAALFESLPTAITVAGQKQLNRSIGQNDIFGMDDAAQSGPPPAQVPPWKRNELLRREKEVFGFYLSGHPCDPLRAELKGCVDHPATLDDGARSQLTLAGMVSSLRTLNSARGAQSTILTLEDGEEVFDIWLHSELLDESRALLEKQNMVVVCADVKETRQGEMRPNATLILGIDDFRGRCASTLQMEVTSSQLDDVLIAKFKGLLNHCSSGDCDVLLRYRQECGTVALLKLGKDNIRLSGALLESVRGLVGEEQVTIHYDAARIRSPRSSSPQPS